MKRLLSTAKYKLTFLSSLLIAGCILAIFNRQSPPVSKSASVTTTQVITSTTTSPLTLVTRRTTTNSPARRTTTSPTRHTTATPTRRCNSTDGGFITGSFSKCLGMGNLIWRYASLKAIATQLNRTAYFPALPCMRAYVNELKDVFPNFSKELLLMNPPNGSKAHKVSFAHRCCEFEDPHTSLLCNGSIDKHKYVQLSAYYLQSPHFFHHDPALRADVLRSFECSPTTTAKMGKIMNGLLGCASSSKNKSTSATAPGKGCQNDSYLLCVHNRRGDFIRYMWESRPEFVRAAIPAVIDSLSSHGLLSSGNSSRPLSVLLLGDDRKFNTELIPTLLQSTSEGKIHYSLIPTGNKRGEELCLAVHHCDSLVITSHASTYGWWVGYLMRERSRLQLGKRNGHPTKQVFYKAEKNEREIIQRSGFPDDWIPMRLRMLIGPP